MKPRSRWAVVGGGVLGMTLAHLLAKRGQEVELFEAAPEFGGLASAWSLGDTVWDRHYHVTLLSDLRLRALLEELGLEKEMKWVETRTGFFTNGKLYSMSNTLEFLKFPPLKFIEKLRLGGTIFLASKIKNWQKLEQVTVSDWLTKWSGKGVFNKIWLPLLRAKMGENYKIVSAAFIWAHISRMYAARRTGLKKEMFGYVPGGYARILSRFAEVLEAEGVKLHLGKFASRVTSQVDGQVEMEFQDGYQDRFDRVVFTTPSHVVASCCDQLTEDERLRFTSIDYQGIVCASVLLKKPVAEYYVTNITDPEIPLTAVIDMSTIVDPAELGGRHLIYLPKYVTKDDDTINWTDEQIRERFLGALFKMHPHLGPEDVDAFRVSRVKSVMALPTLNYSKGLPPMKTSVPGVYAVNSAHILKGNLNVNESITIAEEAIDRVLLADVEEQQAYLHEVAAHV